MKSFRITLVAITQPDGSEWTMHDELSYIDDSESQLFSEEDVYTPEFLAEVIEGRKSDWPFNNYDF